MEKQWFLYRLAINLTDVTDSFYQSSTCYSTLDSSYIGCLVLGMQMALGKIPTEA